MINVLTNKNLKDLLSKKKLNPELLMEIKTSYFLHPSRPAGGNEYYFTFSNTPNGEVFYLFTSLDEYNKCFGDDKELEPGVLYFNEFERGLYDGMLGIIINPGSDNFLIPLWPAFHIIADIKSNNEVYEDSFSYWRVYEDNDILHHYCQGKKTFKFYSKLFQVLSISKLYTLVCSQNNLDDCFKEGKLSFNETDATFYKKDSYYLMYSDLDLIIKDVKDLDGYFYYLIADAVQLAKLSFEFDYEGIILKTPEGDFTLPRKSLLKHYEIILKEYNKRENAHEFAFKLEAE